MAFSDNPSVIDYLLEPFADKLKETAFDYKAFKEEQYDKLAAMSVSTSTCRLSIKY